MLGLLLTRTTSKRTTQLELHRGCYGGTPALCPTWSAGLLLSDCRRYVVSSFLFQYGKFNLSTCWLSENQPTSQSASQPPTNQPVSQPPTNQPVSQPTTNQPTSQPTTSQPANHQPVSQPPTNHQTAKQTSKNKASNLYIKRKKNDTTKMNLKVSIFIYRCLSPGPVYAAFQSYACLWCYRSCCRCCFFWVDVVVDNGDGDVVLSLSRAS